MFTGARYGWMQRILVWAGVALMVASAVWLELLPVRPHFAKSEASMEALTGPITRVVIDAGHGGNDSGAMRDGVLEKNLTIDVARRLDQILRTKGLATTLTRNGDETVSLAARAAAANQARDCVFVSIHFDEGSRAAATGVQTFYAAQQTARPLVASWLPFFQQATSAPDNLQSQSLAGFIQDELVTQTQAFNRGTRAEQFYVITKVRHPAVLVEGGFLSNNDDMLKLVTDEYRHRLAMAISSGIMRYREIASESAGTLVVREAGD